MALYFNARQGLSVGPSALLSIDASNNLTVANLTASGSLFTSNLVATIDTGRYAANAIRFRNSAANQATQLTLMPNGSSITTAVRLYNTDDVTGTNLGATELALTGSGVTLNGFAFGTGTAPTTLSIGLSTSITAAGGLSITSGPMNLSSGSISTPSLYWSTDTGTGLYRIGSNNIGFAVNGSKVLDINSIGLSITGTILTSSDLTVGGNLIVNGTTTTINAATLDVADKNISLGKVGTPSDATATGGGITLLGTTNKTLIWNNSTNGWESNESIQLATGKTYRINGVDVLTGSSLGSGVTGSSLTSVGTIGTGTWQGTIIDGQYGGTGIANTGKTITLGGNLITSGAFATTLISTNTTSITLPTTGTLATLAGTEALSGKTYNALSLTANAIGFTISGGTTAVAATFAGGAAYTISGTNGTSITLPTSSGTLALNTQVFYLGTIPITINRTSGPLALTGITSIDGNSGSATVLQTARNINGVSFNGSADITVPAGGSGADGVFYENGQTVTVNYTITNGKNAMSAGPITINTGVIVTIPTGSVWSVV